MNENNDIITDGRVLHKAAYVYDLFIPIFTFFQGGILNKRAVELLELKQSDMVLDLGCATGDVTLRAASKLSCKVGGLAIGIDASKEMIGKANKKSGQLPVHFEIGISEHLKIEDEYFDKAVSTFLFHHLNYQAKIDSIAQVYRVLKPGGKFILADIDKPDNFFGTCVMLGAEILFNQPEIGENRKGALGEILKNSPFKEVSLLESKLGYISYYELLK